MAELTPVQKIIQASETAQEASSVLEQVVEGSDTTVVVTAGGRSLPSIAKWYKDAFTTMQAFITAEADRSTARANEANIYKNAASSSATSATSSASAASTSASNALASKNAAATSESNALSYEQKSEKWADNNEDVAVETGKYSAKHHALKSSASASSSASSASSASSSATSATSSKNAAASSASAAATSATNASSSASSATSSKNAAATSATNALASENKAQSWAEQGEDVIVETGQYSSKHHALKSSASASSASSSASSATSSKNAAATSASNAATSETNALASKNAAASSASAAASSESNAASSASSALSSKNAAATSETNALASKNAASTSASNASAMERESKLNVQKTKNVFTSMGALSKRYVPSDAISVSVTAYEDNTKVFINDVLITTLSAFGTYNYTASIDDEIICDKPFSCYTNFGDHIPALCHASNNFGFYVNRNNVQSTKLYSPYADTTVEIYVENITAGTGPTDITQTPTATITVPKGQYTSFVYDSSLGDYTVNDQLVYRVVSVSPILVFHFAGSSDVINVLPASKNIILPYAYDKVDTMYGSSAVFYSSDLATNVAAIVGDENDFVFSTGIADGAGTDAEGHIPVESISDMYMITHDIRDYRIIAVEACTVSITNAAGAVLATHKITDASFETPKEIRIGTQAGTDPVLYSGPVYVSGTAPFAFRTNDPGQNEYVALGYYSRFRSAMTDGNLAGTKYAQSKAEEAQAATATSEANAATSESNAAQSATDAQTYRNEVVQVAASVTGQLFHAGEWDASTGAPPVPTDGNPYYKITTAGTINTVEYGVGDNIVWDGAAWYKVDNTEAVTSVNGKQGVVNLVPADVNLGTADDVEFNSLSIKGNRLSVTGGVSINPSNGTNKVYTEIANKLTTEGIAFTMRGDDLTDRMAWMFDYGNTGTFTERMSMLANNGYVGINKTTPSFQLDVNGTFNASGAATFGDSVTINNGAVIDNGLIVRSNTTGNVGDAILSIVSDRDNNNANDNPILELSQKGSGRKFQFGMDATDGSYLQAYNGSVWNTVFTASNAGVLSFTSTPTVGANAIYHEGNVPTPDEIDLTISRKVGFTANGGTGTENGINTWAKILEVDFGTSNSNDASGVLTIVNEESGGSGIATLAWKIRQNTSGSNDGLVLDAFEITGNNIDETCFKIVSNDHGSVKQLWMKKLASYSTFTFYKIADAIENGFTINYSQGSAWQSAVPTGTREQLVTPYSWAGKKVFHEGHIPEISEVNELQTALDGKLGLNAKADNSELLDGFNSSQFMRRDISSIFNSDITVDYGSGSGAARFTHTAGSTVFKITPHNGTGFDASSEIIYNTSNGWWNLKGAPRADGSLILNAASVVNNLTGGGVAVPLSAQQGVALKGLIDTINTTLASNDVTLDSVQEIVDYIKLTRSDLDGLGIAGVSGLTTALNNKIETSKITDNLLSVDATTVLSGNQGRVLKGLIDNINAVIASDDTTLDELQEIVNYIKLNRTDLDALSIASIAGLQAALDNKVDDSQVLTNVPAGAVFTDTTYTVGNGGLTEINFTTAYKTKVDGIAAGANLYDLADLSTVFVGGNLTGDRTVNIDIQADDVNNFFSSRITREAGQNGALILTNAGTGNIKLDGAATETNSLTLTDLTDQLVFSGGSLGSTRFIDLDHNSLDVTDGLYYRLGRSSTTTGDVKTVMYAGDGTNSPSITFDHKASSVSALGTLTSGEGSGGISLNVNDGYGNANITFNHHAGLPEQDGNSARISVNTDATTDATIIFGVKSGVTSGVAASTTDVLTLSESSMNVSDNYRMYFGTGADAGFFCNGTHMYTDLGTEIGNWYIRDGTTTRFTFDDAGHFTATGNVTAYSDERLKKDWEDLSPTFVDDLANVKSGTFARIDNAELGRQVGVSAQSLQKILPEAVQVIDSEDPEDDTLTVSYGNAALAACIELAKEVVELRKRIGELENK